MNKIDVFHGNIVFSESEERLRELTDGYLVVENGIVLGVYDALPETFSSFPVQTFDGVMIPAFSDLHVHAPQYPQRGLKTDALLSDWLTRYTFPLESRYEDDDFAEEVYDKFVDDLLFHGTMHVVCFGTIHRRATSILLEKLEQKGLLSYVGKVNMDAESPDSLREKTEKSLTETEIFLNRYLQNRYAKPLLTPRFAPTCSPKLLSGLGKLAEKYGVGVQTHLVESRWEAAEAVRLHPGCACDTEIYERAGLLGHGPLVGAHFIFPSEKDVEILQKYDGFAVQCPDATINVIAGIMPTARLAERSVRLAYGSDIAAGQSLGVFRQVARSVQLSKVKNFYEPDHGVLSFSQAFYFATKSAGSLFGKVGSFEKGYSFDALIVDGLTDPFLTLRPAEVVERFCYAGETANVRARYLRGKRI